MTELGRRLDATWSVLGSFHKAALPGEAPARENARRSLVAARDIAADDLLQWRLLD
jgi:hypothetical protein